MRLETVAVCTKSLQVGRFIVPPVPIYVVNVKLADVYWLEVAVLAVILFVDCVWVLALDDVTSIDSKASESTGSS